TILRLKQRVEELEKELSAAQKAPPAGTSDLAKGEDPLQLTFRYMSRIAGTFVSKEKIVATTYNEAFSAISPLMIDKASEQQLLGALRDHFTRQLQTEEEGVFTPVSLAPKDFHDLKIQLRALGLIDKSTSPRSLK